jgi:hypothetical protein
MKVNLRTILISLFIILVILSTTSYLFFRVTENQIVVNKMVKFNEVQPDSERVVEDKEAVKQFTYAVRFADKQPGQVDIADPPFQFTLGNKQYYLWVSEQFGLGTLMKLSNTGTVYRIGKSRAKTLLDILKKEYETHTLND